MAHNWEENERTFFPINNGNYNIDGNLVRARKSCNGKQYKLNIWINFVFTHMSLKRANEIYKLWLCRKRKLFYWIKSGTKISLSLTKSVSRCNSSFLRYGNSLYWCFRVLQTFPLQIGEKLLRLFENVKKLIFNCKNVLSPVIFKWHWTKKFPRNSQPTNEYNAVI